MYKIKAKYYEIYEDEQSVYDVDIIGWDRDKRFLFINKHGKMETQKTFFFDVKRSNRWHMLANYSYDFDEDDYHVEEWSRKEGDNERKRYAKVNKTYQVLWRLDSSSEDCRKFRTLKSALSFASEIGKQFSTEVSFWTEGGYKYYSTPLVENYDGEWQYYGIMKSYAVSENTLSNWCYEQWRK